MSEKIRWLSVAIAALGGLLVFSPAPFTLLGITFGQVLISGMLIVSSLLILWAYYRDPLQEEADANLLVLGCIVAVAILLAAYIVFTDTEPFGDLVWLQIVGWVPLMVGTLTYAEHVYRARA